MAFSTMKHMKFSEYSNRPGNVHFSEQPCFDPDLPTITDFFKDRDIFITGGSGFMGKVLIEKLLRSCPGINKIFLLVRPKKGKDITERLDVIQNTRVKSN
jgi:alcohol-forming fatty acyl-CoA reductase